MHVGNAGRVGLMGTLLCSFPLLTHPCRDALVRLVAGTCYRKRPAAAEVLREALWGRFACSLLVCGTALVIATAVGNVVVIWSFAGSTTSILISYLLPSLFYLKLRKGPVWGDRHKCRAAVLLAGSVVMLVVCTCTAVYNTMVVVGQ